MHINRTICDSEHAPVAVAAGRPRHAFTLVELMVVIVIIGILASLTLAGLAGVRQRAKIEKTKSTIRKIDAVIQPMYESYLTRRVNISGLQSGLPPLVLAAERLRLLRATMMNEMPDTWTEANAALNMRLIDSGYRPSAVAFRYHRRFAQMESQPTRATHEAAETLYLILALGGRYPDAIANFRSDEIGDLDQDTAPEFLDGWGQPIRFRRWPIGFALVTGQPPAPDPFDPLRITALANPPSGDPESFPLIFSCGPDDALEPRGSDAESGYAESRDWLSALTAGPLTGNHDLPGIRWTFKDQSILLTNDPERAQKSRDNITNYDLMRK